MPVSWTANDIRATQLVLNTPQKGESGQNEIEIIRHFYFLDANGNSVSGLKVWNTFVPVSQIPTDVIAAFQKLNQWTIARIKEENGL